MCTYDSASPIFVLEVNENKCRFNVMILDYPEDSLYLLHFLVRVCRVYLEPDVAYRLLQLLRRTGTQPGALTILTGTGTLMPFLFFYLPRPLPCGSGDRR
jgi:hypothetical protein